MPETPPAATGGFPFRDRPPDDRELTRLVLTLSTYRDGSGMVNKYGKSQPGWRDLERATASALGGICPENKGVFDVEVAVRGSLPYGLSLKMASYDSRKGQVLMELSNSNAKFWLHLENLGIKPETDPQLSGPALIDLVMQWHELAAGSIDLAHSSYVLLTHDQRWRFFQLFWYRLSLLNDPDPSEMQWGYSGRRIHGSYRGKVIWDWYGWAGGQLKWYPLVEWAHWYSPPFELEDPPIDNPADKAVRYWPTVWPK